MATFRVLRLAYAALGIYLVLIVGLTDFPLDIALSALLQGMLLLLCFRIGFGRTDAAEHQLMLASTPPPWLLGRSAMTKLSFAVASLVAAVVAAEHYTGQSPVEILSNLLDGRSLYNLYQVYNTDLLAAGPSVGIHSLLLAYVKGMSMLCVFSLVARRVTLKRADIVLLTSAVAAHLYIGVARGTNLEIFEVGLLLAFAILERANGRALEPRTKVALGIVAATLVVTFLSLLAARGASLGTLEGEVNFDPMKPLAQILGPIAPLIVQAYAYLGFGSFVIGTYWVHIWLTSPGQAVAGLLPGGIDLATGVSADRAVRSMIDVGVRWVPDAVHTLGAMGLLSFLTMIAAMAWTARVTADRGSISGYFVNYFVLLQMISFPLGGFLRVSSTNLIIIVVVATHYALSRRGVLAEAAASRRRAKAAKETLDRRVAH